MKSGKANVGAGKRVAKGRIWLGVWVMAGLSLGAIAARIVKADEPVATVLYCTYQVTGLTNANIIALQTLGYPVQIDPFVNNTGHFCVECANTGSCGTPVLPVGFTGMIVSQSDSCGACGAGILL